MAAERYRVQVPIRYPTNPNAPRRDWVYREVAAGKVVTDIPASSRAWLIEQGCISPVQPRKRKGGASGDVRE